jgi:hypothetical protein
VAEQSFRPYINPHDWCARARLHLGEAWVPTNAEPSDDQVVQEDSGDAGIAIPAFINEALFKAPQSAEVAAEAPQLRWIAAMLGLVPLGVLDADSWTDANFAWLLDLRSSVDPARELRIDEWITTELPSVLADVKRLCSALLQAPDGGGASLAARVIQARSVVDPLEPLQNVPFMIGAIALVERCFARWPSATRSNLYRKKWAWRELALQALDIAPRLFAFDLCLFDLLLADEFPQADLPADDAGDVPDESESSEPELVEAMSA